MDKSKVLKQLKLVPDDAKQQSWDAKETPEGAQAKATKALEDAKQFVQENAFTLEPATAEKLGGVKVGTGISVTEDGVISATELNWENIANKPEQFAPSTHTHQAIQITEDDTHKFVTQDEKNKIGQAILFDVNEESINDANDFKRTGYIKVGNGTSNLPSVCNNSSDKWGTLEFVMESVNGPTGHQIFRPIDGAYKGRLFTRAFCKSSWSEWKLASDFSGSYNDLSNKPTIDETLNKESLNPVQNKAITIEIEQLKANVNDLLYKPIVINSFGNNINTVEMGTIVTDITFNWTLNKTPKTLMFGEETLETSAKSKTLNRQNIRANKNFTLKATDERDHTTTKTTSIQFLNGIYYGVATANEEINNTFLHKLTKKLQGGKNTTFTVNAGEGQHIFYAVPARYGSCNFNVGGFDGGFTKVNTFDYTNPSGYNENYDVYKSDNANLGNTTVKVS